MSILNALQVLHTGRQRTERWRQTSSTHLPLEDPQPFRVAQAESPEAIALAGDVGGADKAHFQRLSSDPRTPRTSARPMLLPIAEVTERVALLTMASPIV